MTHLPSLIYDLAIILTCATLVTLIFKKLRQPVVLGYIIAGFLVGPSVNFIPNISNGETIKIWAEIGVIFLLFGLGLEFSFKKLSAVGPSASIMAMTEVIFMSVLGYVTGQLLGWNFMDSLFLGGILCISSTTIIIKAFDELGVKKRNFARLVFGVLVIEDLVAILLLVLLTTISVSQQFQGSELVFSILKLSFFLILWFIAGVFLLPGLLKSLKSVLNDEMLLILSITLCLLMVVLASSVGFSPALGAFIMGSLLAETSQGKKIEVLIDPVKNLFAAIFFVSVGTLIDVQVISENWQSIILISILTIIGKIVSTTFGALVAGQRMNDSVQAGMSLAQIGEFSFIIATLGLTLKVTSGFLYPLAVMVSVLTTFTSPIMIKHSENFSLWLEKNLPQKLLESLHRYRASTQLVSTSSTSMRALRGYLLKLVSLLTIIVAITFLGINFIHPINIRVLGNGFMTSLLSFGVTFFACAPFFWAMLQGKINESLATLGMSRGQVFLTYSLSFSRYILLASILSIQLTFYFSTLWAAIVFLFISILVIRSFSGHLGGVYAWFEANFIKNLEAGPSESDALDVSITPWNAHLNQYVVSASFPELARSLLEISVREKFGVTIVMIERGGQKIKAPGPNERLYPYDRLSVIGTDSQLKKFREYIEGEHLANTVETTAPDEYILSGLTITEDSPYIGKSIRTSGIREVCEGLVVGLEREATRIVSPDSNTEIKLGDVVWIVGNRAKLKSLRSH